MKITQMHFHDGARVKICRLGLAHVLLELQERLLSIEYPLDEDTHIGDMPFFYSLINGVLEPCDGWERPSAIGVNWVKHFRYDQRFLARLGVDLWIPSSGSESVRNVMHLRGAIVEGLIDVGVVVVPDDRLQVFLPDRTPAFRDAVRYIEEEFKEAMNYPFVIMAVEHDAPGDALPKQARKS